MAVPVTREEFKQHCLRRLGAPVLQVNVDDDQVEDRIDQALKYYQEFHYDATEKIYFKYRIGDADRPDAIHHANVVSGGISYTNGDSLVFTPTQGGGNGAVATVTTDANGVISDITFSSYGSGFAVIPDVTVSSNTGSGASLTCDLGGYIELPDSIIGAVQVFDISTSIVSHDMFSIQYQIALNDLWSLNTYSMIPYYTTISHLSLIQQLLMGSQPIRYTRHRNRLYVDMNWDRVSRTSWLVFTCYQSISPDEFPDIWSDIWLQRYTTALIKQQWGNNLKKFGNQMLPGGIVFNGQTIYDEATNELSVLEHEMIYTYSIPGEMFLG